MFSSPTFFSIQRNAPSYAPCSIHTVSTNTLIRALGHQAYHYPRPNRRRKLFQATCHFQIHPSPVLNLVGRHPVRPYKISSLLQHDVTTLLFSTPIFLDDRCRSEASTVRRWLALQAKSFPPSIPVGQFGVGGIRTAWWRRSILVIYVLKIPRPHHPSP